MIPYVLYDSTGQITRYGVCQDEVLDEIAGPGEFAMEGVGGDLSHYVAAGVITPRPAMPTSIDTLTVVGNGVDVATISGVPNPTDVTIAGAASTSFESTGGTEELTFDTPGAYRVTLRSFPYLDQEYTINAT